MSSTKTTLFPLVLAALFFHARGVHADCVDTVPLSAPERDFMLRANAALKTLLPSAPSAEGLRASDADTNPDQFNVCKGEKKQGDFTVRVSRKFIWPDPKKHSADTVVTVNFAMNVKNFAAPAGNYSGAYGSPSPTLSAGLKVNNVEWKVDAASYGVREQIEQLRGSLAAAIERDRLAALVGKPLPSVAASAAMKKTGPTPLIATSATATASAPAVPGAAPAAATPASDNTGTALPGPAPSTTDTLKEAADTVQKLRGLFGR